MNKLVLIDANALIHRSFHALPSLKTKDGQPIQAVYGFLSLFLKMYKEIKPEYLAIAFDRPEPTFRHKEFAQYKAQRPKTPDELISQIKIVKEIIKSFNLSLFEKPGYEADDIIGSFVEKFKKNKNLEKIIIVTGDLDILQLVEDDRIVVWTLKTGISQTIVYNEEKIKERFLLSPKQLIDFKALKGDPSDNIPGLPSIGQKTAQKLIDKFKNIENLYIELKNKPKKFSDFSERIINILKENKELAFFSKELVSLRLDINVDVSLSDLKISLDQEKAKEIFDKYGFFSLWPRFLEAFGFKKKEEIKEKNQDKAKELSCKEAKKIVFKKEIFLNLKKENLLPDSEILEVLNNGVFFKIKENIDCFLDFIFRQRVTIVGYDLKRFLKRTGKKPKAKIIDLKIANWLLSPQRSNFDLEKDYLRIFKAPLNKPAVFGIEKIFHEIIHEIKNEKLEKVFFEIELLLIYILAKMEVRGVKIDKQTFLDLKDKIEKKLSSLKKEIHKIAGREFNINSSQQVSEILFNTLKISSKPLAKTPKGAISTRSEELLKIKKENPIIEKIILYKELSKLLNTYIIPLPKITDKLDRLHPEFIQTGTATGRLACHNPNLQNIPSAGIFAKDLRKGFISPNNFYLISFDYSQIELRIAAFLSGDTNLKKAFLENKDIHQETAKAIFGTEEISKSQRRIAKVLNFGVLYGMGKKTLSQTAGISVEEANNFIEKYFLTFPELKNYQKMILKQAEENGFLETFFGRRRFFENINSSNQRFRAQDQRSAINFPIQGTAADIIKIAMIRVEKLIEERNFQNKVNLILQIHDELIFEVEDNIIEEAVSEIKKEMEKFPEIDIPLKVNINKGKNLFFG